MPGEQAEESCGDNQYGYHEKNQYKSRDAHRPPTGSLPQQDSMRPAALAHSMPLHILEIGKVSNGASL
jgi:hypothetical protein